ncbi:hypothetical protein ACS0TY_019760 [Phlomoides rotata]
MWCYGCSRNWEPCIAALRPIREDEVTAMVESIYKDCTAPETWSSVFFTLVLLLEPLDAVRILPRWLRRSRKGMMDEGRICLFCFVSFNLFNILILSSKSFVRRS